MFSRIPGRDHGGFSEPQLRQPARLDGVLLQRTIRTERHEQAVAVVLEAHSLPLQQVEQRERRLVEAHHGAHSAVEIARVAMPEHRDHGPHESRGQRRPDVDRTVLLQAPAQRLGHDTGRGNRPRQRGDDPSGVARDVPPPGPRGSAAVTSTPSRDRKYAMLRPVAPAPMTSTRTLTPRIVRSRNPNPAARRLRGPARPPRRPVPPPRRCYRTRCRSVSGVQRDRPAARRRAPGSDAAPELRWTAL